MAGRILRIFFHDRCFDGAASAAYFWEFYRGAIDPGASLELCGMVHRRGDPFEDADLDADDNACVDFRYCPDPRMTWWFDHHASAFQPPAERSQFEQDQSGQKFFDPLATSCAGFMSRVLARERAFSPDDPQGHWRELIQWAEVLDGARFGSAAEALDLDLPALQVSTWLRDNRDDELVRRLIRSLGRRSLGSIAKEPWIASAVERFRRLQAEQLDLLRERAQVDGGVVSFDLSRDDVAAMNSFAAYALFPAAIYTIGVTATDEVCKVSVGYNPWAPEPRQHNIAELCERYGGGGHPVVGAISLEPGEVDAAREVAVEVARALRAPQSSD